MSLNRLVWICLSVWNHDDPEITLYAVFFSRRHCKPDISPLSCHGKNISLNVPNNAIVSETG